MFGRSCLWQVRGYLPDTKWPPAALLGPLRGPFFQAERRQCPSKRAGSKCPPHEPHRCHIVVWNVCVLEGSKCSNQQRQKICLFSSKLRESLASSLQFKDEWRLQETKLSQKLVWASLRLHSLWGGNQQEIKGKKKQELLPVTSVCRKKTTKNTNWFQKI